MWNAVDRPFILTKHTKYEIRNEMIQWKETCSCSMILHTWKIDCFVLKAKIPKTQKQKLLRINERNQMVTQIFFPSFFPLNSKFRRVFIVLFDKNCFHHIFWPCKHFIRLSVTPVCVLAYVSVWTRITSFTDASYYTLNINGILCSNVKLS